MANPHDQLTGAPKRPTPEQTPAPTQAPTPVKDQAPGSKKK